VRSDRNPVPAARSRPDRYGPAPRAVTARGRRLRVALAIAGVVAAVAAVTAVWLVERPGVDAGVTRIRFVSAHRVDVTFEVHKPADATAVCVVRARDAHGVQTGYAQVTVGPTRESVVTTTYRLATRNRAVTGELAGCRLRSG
jgi:Domain of unknown function (DUF4307)